MENTGAITFRERLLLVDPERASLGVRKNVAGDHLARDRAPVVRQPRDDEVVERHLAERGVRHLDRQQAARRMAARMERRPGRRAGDADGAGPRRAAVDAGDPDRGRNARRDQRGLRRHRLREDRGRPAHDRGVRRPGVIPEGDRVVPDEVLLRQCRRRGLLERDDARHRHGRSTASCRATSSSRARRCCRSAHAMHGHHDGDHRSRRSGSSARLARRPAAQSHGRCPCASRRTTASRAARCSIGRSRRSRRQAARTSSPTPTAAATTSPSTLRTPCARSRRSVAGLKPVERISLLGDEWWMVRAGRHDIGVYLDLAGSLAGDETAAVTEAYRAAARRSPASIIVRRRPAAALPGVDPRALRPGARGARLPGDPRDSDERHSRRAELLTLVGVTGNDAGACSAARASLPLGYIAQSGVAAGHAGADGAAGGRGVGRRHAVRPVLAQLEKLARAAGGVLPLLQRAAVVPRPGAGPADAAVRHLAGGADAGHRHAHRRPARRAMGPATRRGRSSRRSGRR